MATTYIQKLLDLPNEVLGLLHVVGSQQLPFQDGQGHLRAGSEVKVCDWRQRDGGTGSVLHSLKLHHFHGRDRLKKEEGRENASSTRLLRKANVASIPWLRHSVRESWFPPSFKHSEGPQSPENP